MTAYCFRAKLKAQPTVGGVTGALPLGRPLDECRGLLTWLIITRSTRALSQIELFAMQAAVGTGDPTPVLLRVGGPTDRSGIQRGDGHRRRGSSRLPNVRSIRPTSWPPTSSVRAANSARGSGWEATALGDQRLKFGIGLRSVGFESRIRRSPDKPLCASRSDRSRFSGAALARRYRRREPH